MYIDIYVWHRCVAGICTLCWLSLRRCSLPLGVSPHRMITAIAPNSYRILYIVATGSREMSSFEQDILRTVHESIQRAQRSRRQSAPITPGSEPTSASAPPSAAPATDPRFGVPLMMHVQMVNQLTGITATITRVAPFPSERMSTNVLPAGMMRFHPGMMSASANSVSRTQVL